MFRNPIQRLAALGAGGLLAGAIAVPAMASTASHQGPSKIKHVLLISVDGLHQADLSWYVGTHPGSALAALVKGGVDYTNAQTPVPSDSFPGMIAQATGGNPKTTGIYYDDTYNHSLLPAGTTNCVGVKPGTEVALTEAAAKDPLSIDSGQGLTGLPGSILQLTGTPVNLLNLAALPVDPKTCKPLLPHQFIGVNTIFEVAKQHNLRTAWSDKHAAYEILAGPSGKGLDDLFTPEINSAALGYTTTDWTTDNAATQQYDGYKAQAVLNEIDGFDHSHTTKVGTPAIFGLNFQSVSTAEKLPTSDGLTGGYLAGGKIPGPLLTKALDFVNSRIGAFSSELRQQGLDKSTAIVLSAKHGQSPTDPATLTRIPDGPIIDGINAAWTAAHPGAGALVIFSTDDDVMQLWLSDRSQKAANFVKHYLLTHSATGNKIDGTPRTLQASGLAKVYAGESSAKFFGVSVKDPRHADVFGIVQHGVVYTGGKKKIAEHGGADAQDRNVPIVIAGPGVLKGWTNTQQAETTEIAPTILKLLGLDPNALQAVQIEHTKVLRFS